MIASTHLAVGAAAGLMAQMFLSANASNLERLFWAFTAGVVSHVVLDALPHREYPINGLKLGLVLLAEISVVFALVLSSWNTLLLNSLIFFGMAGGAIPDVIELVYFYLFSWSWLSNLGKVIHYFHHRNQASAGFVFSFNAQVILAILAAIFVRSRSAS
jgi:hypothetical protein